MRHLLRNYYRQFHQTANLAVFVPRRLVNQFFLALFRDGVDVGGSVIQQVADDLLRTLVVASHHVFAAHIAVDTDRAIVLIHIASRMRKAST